MDQEKLKRYLEETHDRIRNDDPGQPLHYGLPDITDIDPVGGEGQKLAGVPQQPAVDQNARVSSAPEDSRRDVGIEAIPEHASRDQDNRAEQDQFFRRISEELEQIRETIDELVAWRKDVDARFVRSEKLVTELSEKSRQTPQDQERRRQATTHDTQPTPVRKDQTPQEAMIDLAVSRILSTRGDPKAELLNMISAIRQEIQRLQESANAMRQQLLQRIAQSEAQHVNANRALSDNVQRQIAGVRNEFLAANRLIWVTIGDMRLELGRNNDVVSRLENTMRTIQNDAQRAMKMAENANTLITRDLAALVTRVTKLEMEQGVFE